VQFFFWSPPFFVPQMKLHCPSRTPLIVGIFQKRFCPFPAWNLASRRVIWTFHLLNSLVLDFFFQRVLLRLNPFSPVLSITRFFRSVFPAYELPERAERLPRRKNPLSSPLFRPIRIRFNSVRGGYFPRLRALFTQLVFPNHPFFPRSLLFPSFHFNVPTPGFTSTGPPHKR